MNRLRSLKSWFRNTVKPWLVGFWVAFVDATPALLGAVTAVTGYMRVAGTHGPSYQAFAHMLVACLFTLGVCREWSINSKLYTGLAVWLVVVEVLSFLKLA